MTNWKTALVKTYKSHWAHTHYVITQEHNESWNLWQFEKTYSDQSSRGSSTFKNLGKFNSKQEAINAADKEENQ